MTTKKTTPKTEKNPKGAGRPVNTDAKARFLLIYPDYGTIEHAAKEAGVSAKTVYNWIKADAEFTKQVEDIRPVAKSVYVGVLEAEAHRRAVKGVLEPVFYQGKLVSRIRKFSDVLLIVLLKANAPEKYIERQAVEHTGNIGIQIKEVEVRLSGNSNPS
jgi:hypothetical protein